MFLRDFSSFLVLCKQSEKNRTNPENLDQDVLVMILTDIALDISINLFKTIQIVLIIK